MKEIRFLTVEEVITIQKSTLPNSGSPDTNKLEGALFRVQALRDYEGCRDVFTLAGMYMIAIAKSHAFHDGNKRTAFQAASVFLLLNGHELTTSLELVKLTIFAATGEANLDNVTFTLKVLSDYRSDLLSDTVASYS